jgi:hypothetical protein
MAKTYAVVEFESTRECAVVPVLWIVQNGTQCYWPRTKTEEAFHKLLAEVAPYQKSWRLFPVRRVLYTNGELEDSRKKEHLLNRNVEDFYGKLFLEQAIFFLTRYSKISPCYIFYRSLPEFASYNIFTLQNCKLKSDEVVILKKMTSLAQSKSEQDLNAI